MASKDRPKPPFSSSAPPPKINVQKFAESRAAELESLYAVVASRLDGDLRSHRSKRRRTTAFDREAAGRRRKSRRQDRPRAGAGGQEVARVSRRARRREDLRANHERGFSVAGDGTRRLRTHVWHAKRFTMTKLWGYCLPLGLHGRGRGSRALLKRFRDGVLIHDASYHVAVQLEGPQVSLLSILSMVLVTSPSNQLRDPSDCVISGFSYGNAMLHHLGELSSKAIVPVTYMWRPCCLPNRDNDDNDVAGVTDQPETAERSSFRQLWVWIHCSAFSEGYEALKFACQKEMDESGNSINCFSLEGQLAKLEVMGSKAFPLLQKTLTVASISQDSVANEKHSVPEGDDSKPEKISVLDNEGQSSSKAILDLYVIDPRATTKKRELSSVPESTSNDMVVDFPQNKVGAHADLAEVSEINKESFSLWSESCSYSTLACKSLWDMSSGVIPPVEESLLCKEKHELRNSLFCINGSVPTELQRSRCCPIILLKNEYKKSLSIGWSVILPISWLKAFWIPLVSNGGHAIGLREKHWVACDVGLPSFPSDFPDCNAYSSLKANEAAASSLTEELRVPAMRPLRVPIPPPWDCVRVTLNSVLMRSEHPKNFREEKDCHDTTEDSEPVGDSNSLDSFVARTSCSLTSFLNEIKGNHLLLFPQVADRKMSFPEFAEDESKLAQAQNGIANINYNHKLCFLRVLLHAYKEGSFEEGAVICAPRLSDIALWTSSESIEEGLQIPHSALTTYFKEHSSGKWELPIPEDSAASEHHRLPIGFVTTGFVRGSKKLVAEAFCEAVLLAHLRYQQWSNFPVKRRRKEIFVLVRNLRSTAYRLALATIVLEQYQEDTESL